MNTYLALGFHWDCFLCWVDLISKIATALGIFVAALGVWYARSQIKGFRKDLKMQAFQNKYQMFMEMDKILIERPELKKLISNKGFFDLLKSRNINDDDIREIAFIEMVMNVSQLSYFQFENDLNNSGLNWLKELLENESIKKYWHSSHRCRYRQEFEKFIDNYYEQAFNS